MTIALAISTNPLINRFAEPEDLISVCANEIGISRLQLTHEFINPAWPLATQHRLVARYASACAKHGVDITSLCTGAYARINNLGHPDDGVRKWTEQWMMGLVDIASDLGARSAGSQFAIFTYQDFDDPQRKEALLSAVLASWAEICAHAQKRGLDHLFWEHMSIGREFGETLSNCRTLMNRISTVVGPGLKVMLDVDHGDVASGNSRDTDPYAWLEAFGGDCRILHLKQASANKGGHWPFVEPYNSTGRIKPDELLSAIKKWGHPEMELCLELAFREREPNDRQAVDLLRQSVEYWKPYV
jgi:sugar phosphate isomerase/epimerase